MKLLEAIYLIAIGFSFASVFVIVKRVKTSSRLLMGYLWGYLLILGVSNLMLLFIMTGWMIYFPFLFKIFMPLSFVAPVLLYWYVRGSLDNTLDVKGLKLIHLFPALIVFIHYLPFLLRPIAEKQRVVREVISNNDNIVNYSYGWIFTESEIFISRTFQAIVYLVLSWMALKRFQKQNEVANNRSRLVTKWLRFILRATIIYTALLIVCYSLFAFRFNGIELGEWMEQITFNLTALMMLVLSSYLLINPAILVSIGRPVDTVDFSLDGSIESVIDILVHQGLYRNTDLKLVDLLSQINFDKSEFSNLLKASGYRTFNHFINEVRLDCFVKEASSDALEKASIEGVAFKCGFKSQATFYRVFKQKYDTSPIAYLQGVEKAQCQFKRLLEGQPHH